ncbi:hypothetical protein [Clostridium luticellarii]|uniref:Uncharacterized protein n=1 Tax=Clostridium luticellarii TaxID=1691940 RepID=A0A2T0BQ47_9CLOT|nr:hypothetical protein [Clostridium luticellarii]PRR85998.1 hypothetical protein CLLU_10260 [Clostridium luticellarii]
MESIRKKADKVVELVQSGNLGIKEAIDRVKYDLDGDELYDVKTGKTICDIDTATDEQVRILLQTKKDPLQRA